MLQGGRLNTAIHSLETLMRAAHGGGLGNENAQGTVSFVFVTAAEVAGFDTTIFDLSALSTVDALRGGADVGRPWGFCSVITSSLELYERIVRRHMRGNDALLELHISYEVATTLDALGQEDIASGGDGDNVGVLAERLERDRVVNFP